VDYLKKELKRERQERSFDQEETALENDALSYEASTKVTIERH
jgi:hypothetical protein